MVMTRGCGRRVAGGLYACCGLSKEGRPLEDFLFCPPAPIPAGLGLTPVGQQLWTDPATGITHLLDWVGAAFYPNVADFIEEGRAHGFSRRTPTSLDLRALGPGSRLLLAHSRAHVGAYPDYWLGPDGQTADLGACPQHRVGHPHDITMCGCVWWHDLDAPASPGHTYTLRTIGETTYAAWTRPDWITAPRYEPAIFMALPFHFEVVAGQNDAHTAALRAAQRSGKAVQVVEE